eukprot:scaffold3210_cov164-Skeletonema_marinoi.AAC.2
MESKTHARTFSLKIIASAVSLAMLRLCCSDVTVDCDRTNTASAPVPASLLRDAISTDDTPTPTIIVLSQDIPRDEAAISSSPAPGAKAVQEAAAEDPLLRNAMVLENGSIVSSYHRDDVDPNETHEMMMNGRVTDGSTDFRKGVTVEELLTMTSGLIDNHRMSQGTTHGGQSLEGALSYPDLYHRRANWHDSKAIFGRTRDGKLGVGEDEYGWGQNDDGVEAGGGWGWRHASYPDANGQVWTVVVVSARR